jgi:hypothetical protein
MLIRTFENRDEEFAIRNDKVREPLETDAEEIERQRCKNGLREHEIEPHRAPREIEVSVGHEIGPGHL